MKDSFIFHLNNCIELEDLNDAEVGQIFRAMISYTESGVEPEFEDRAVRMAWRRIKDRMDDDNDKYESICERNKANGSKGGRPKTQKTQSVISVLEKNPEEPKETQAEPKKADSESESDIYRLSLNACAREEFTPPTLEEIETEIMAKGYALKADVFKTYYDARGWKDIKDWKALLRSWSIKEGEFKSRAPTKKTTFNDIQKHDYDFKSLDRIAKLI